MADTEQTISYEERVKHVCAIANPLANKKLTKKLYKLVKKAAKTKSMRRGVKEVVKALRKGEKGLCFLAGDISPIDVISHLPILCEESDVHYAFVPSKVDLGAAAASKRPTSCILVTPNKEGFSAKELYDEVATEMEKIQAQY